MFIIRNCPNRALHSAIVVWLFHMAVDMPSLGHCLKPGGTNNVTCVDTEKRALLEFKDGLEIWSHNNSFLSDWNAENMNCCRWVGIKCSKDGRVIALDLGYDIRRKYDYESIGGEIGPSLLDLPYLEFVDLNHNAFSGKIPSFIASLKRLRYLNLSSNYFIGKVPHQLGNLSALETLDLDATQIYLEVDLPDYSNGLELDSLAWISGLSSLEYLNMNGVDMSLTTDWLHSITNLTSLTELYLKDCKLHSPATHKHVNSTKPHRLQQVDLSINELEAFPVSFLSNFKSIKRLDLSGNELEGEIPDFFSTNLSSLLTLDASSNRLSNSSGFLHLGSTSLQELHLDNNKLTGLLPDLSKFPSLRVVTLSNNDFKDNLESFLEKGSRLVEVDISSNSFSKVLREDNFQYLAKLKVLIMSYNSVELNFSTWWTPPFQLTLLKLRNCKLGPRFPLWLRAQSNLTELDISNSGISGPIPSWFWNISSRLQYLNISHNSINNTLIGSLPTFSSKLSVLDLSFNQLYGALPSFSSDLKILDLANNKFSGDISFLCSLKVGSLNSLNLHNNLLSGSLETCWERVDGLQLLNLHNNNLSGYLPHSMGNLRNILLLNLRNNSLSGELPSSMIKCQYLILLDLGDNKLSGVIPTWIGTSLHYLGLLALHANRFTGNIPRALCHLQSMQILDLSFNNISGVIPSCFNNFTAMVNSGTGLLYEFLGHGSDYADFYYPKHYYTTWIEWKGMNREFVKQDHLKLLTLIDLSNNELSGPIPPELASLYKLNSLSLSNNTLTGIIPYNIGQLKMLESLDLSRNLLYGEIPRSMTDLSSLNYLDLSSNNLSGKIPSSTQLQSFDARAFNNNLMLCGPPTNNPCPGDKSEQETPTNHPNWDHKSEAGIFHEDKWFYISIGVGFIVGFWGFCGTLILKTSWRQKYFEVLNNWIEGLYVAILVNISKLSRRVTS